MGTFSSGRGISRIRTRVGTRSQVTGRFIEQNIEITFRAGKHVFKAVGRDFAKKDTEFFLKRELFAKFDQDFFDSFVQGLVMATQEMIAKLLPTVALDTGKLRNTIISLLENIKSSSRIRSATSFSRGTIFQAIINFNEVWATLFYSIYHEIEIWRAEHGRTFYKDPTTKGTAPYSVEQFVIEFNHLSAVFTNDNMIAKGWDLRPIVLPAETYQSALV